MIEFADYIEEKQNVFLSSLSKVDSKIYKTILGIILDNTNNGVFSLSDLDMANLEDEIYESIKKSDYSKLVSNYIGVFDVIESKVIKEQAEINNLKAKNIRDVFDKAQSTAFLKDKVIYNLAQNGVKDFFVKPLADLVKNEAIFNKTSKEVETLLMSKLVDDSYTNKYARQVANDTLNQYDGALNEEIKVAYELNKMKYIGNLVTDSRPICSHIMNDFGGKLEQEQLSKILTEYCPNGMPSDKKIVVTDIQGKEHNFKKGSGMFDGTVLSNFSVNRGGYSCRHRVIWVRKF